MDKLKFVDKEGIEISKFSHKLLLVLIIGILLIGSVASLPIYVKPLDGSALPSVPLFWGRNLQRSTSFDYVFNFTTSIDCTGVVLSNSSTIVTENDGVGFGEVKK